MNATDILNKAAQHMADRAATYDKPEGERSMGRAVEAFNAITGRDLSESEGWLLLQVLKSVRLFTRPGYHADSAEDGVAYAALVAEAKSVEAVSEAWPEDGNSERSMVAKVDSGPMWVEWRGESGEPPVGPEETLEVRLRDGDTEIAPAGDFEWTHDGEDYDIVAWRELRPDDERIDTIGQNGETGKNYTGKPSWNDAPGWAKWLAQSPNGGWYWFNLRPIPKADGSGWFLADSSCHLGQIRFAGTGIASPMWRYTLELRPA